MALEYLQIQRFRNLENIACSLNSGLNLFEGANAQGKTNLIEAIYFLANGHSFRLRDMAALIAWQQPSAQLQGQVRHQGLLSTLTVQLGAEGKKLFWQDKAQARWTKVHACFRALIFTPESPSLFRTAPGTRRNYFDYAMGIHFPQYGPLLRKYTRVLRQRNRMLEDGAPQSLREPFDQQWAEFTQQIMQLRAAYLEQLLPLWQQRLQALTCSHGSLQAVWEGALYTQQAQSVEQLLGALQNSRFEEQRLRKTLLGPNRDDLVAYFEDHPVKDMASQGQQRMLVIALKLAEADLFRQKTGLSPIFLLDDIGSELDPQHLRQLLDSLKDIKAQTFMTTAQKGIFSTLPGQVFQVKAGALQAV